METGDEIDVVVEQVGGSQWYSFFYDFNQLSYKWKSFIRIKEKQKKKRKSISRPFYIKMKISYNLKKIKYYFFDYNLVTI